MGLVFSNMVYIYGHEGPMCCLIIFLVHWPFGGMSPRQILQDARLEDANGPYGLTRSNFGSVEIWTKISPLLKGLANDVWYLKEYGCLDVFGVFLWWLFGLHGVHEVWYYIDVLGWLWSPQSRCMFRRLRIPMVVKVRLTGIQTTSTDERATGKRNLKIDLTVMATT